MVGGVQGHCTAEGGGEEEVFVMPATEMHLPLFFSFGD
jgi:hypothetical protein